MRRIWKQVSQSASRIRRSAKTKRQAYADLRHLISLESPAKKIKLPFLQRAGTNLIDNNSISAVDPARTFSAAEMESISRDGEIATSAESRPESRNVLLVIDQRLSMYYGSKQKMKSVVAAEAAALFAWHAFFKKDRVGAIIFNDREVAVLSPQCSRVQIMLIFHDLLNQNHGLSGKSDRKSNPGMLNQALRRAAAIAQGNFNIVLVTDGSGQDQVTGSILQNVSAHNDLAVILVYDPRQVECNGGDRSNAGSLLNFRANLNHSCFLAEGTLTIPLNNQLDPVDQFRRGFRKLLRLRRYQSKRQVQLPQRGGNDARQDESALGAECGSEATISRLPSPLPNPQPLCVQLNSR